jgi:hypothetical protein
MISYDRVQVSPIYYLLVCILPALAQIDASSLRAKYGPPLAKETFIPRPGIEMVVEYAPNTHVCRIQPPPIAPSREPSVESTQAIDDFLIELAPLAMRGKELRRWTASFGALSMSAIQYENVTISKSLQAGTRTGLTVTFHHEDCRT